MARQLKPDTLLARLILDSGKPAYVIAGEVGINYNRLLDYADGRMRIGASHRYKLDRYFGTAVESTNVVVLADPVVVSFTANVRRARITPGREGVITLLVDQRVGGVRVAWRLCESTNGEFVVTVTELVGQQPYQFVALVEDIRVKLGAGLEIALRVQHEDRDVVLEVARIDLPKRFHFSECDERVGSSKQLGAGDAVQ